jgi:hypothetical protein
MDPLPHKLTISTNRGNAPKSRTNSRRARASCTPLRKAAKRKMTSLSSSRSQCTPKGKNASGTPRAVNCTSRAPICSWEVRCGYNRRGHGGPHRCTLLRQGGRPFILMVLARAAPIALLASLLVSFCWAAHFAGETSNHQIRDGVLYNTGQFVKAGYTFSETVIMGVLTPFHFNNYEQGLRPFRLPIRV